MTTLCTGEMGCPVYDKGFESRTVVATDSLGGKRTDFHERATPLIPVRDYLHAHVEESVSIQSLVRLSGLTEFHLIRAFHREFGLPPHAYHVRLKLARAREMLLSGATVVRTAFACGFADQSHLSRKFKEAYGLAPAMWMRAVAPSSPQFRSRQRRVYAFSLGGRDVQS
jgi:AraC-like DNA-binding protein